MAAVLIGCDQTKEQGPAALPYQGQTIRVVVPKGWGFKELWEVHLNEWNARTGGQVDLVEVDMADGAGPLWDAKAAPQLAIFPWTRRGELLADRLLQSLPDESLTELQLDWSDLFQGLREKQARIDSGTGLVPIASPVLVCYYRADLLDKAGLKPPVTWEDYQRLLDDLQNWAPGLTAAEPWSPEFRATMFGARAVSYVKHAGHYSVYFDIENGQSNIASPGFVKALDASRLALKKMPAEVLTYDPVTCRNLVISGKAALAIGLETGPAAGPLYLDANVPSKSDKPATVTRAPAIALGFSRLPGSSQVFNTTVQEWVAPEDKGTNVVTLTGFAGLCAGVPRGTDPAQAAAALNLLSGLLMDATTPFPAGARSLCRESQATEAGAWVGKDLSAAEAGKYVSVLSKALRDRQQTSEIPVIGHAEFRAALSAGLTKALEGDDPSADILRDVSSKWDEILKRLGTEKVRASYRSALGLSRLEEL